jgi:hypothetical protein
VFYFLQLNRLPDTSQWVVLTSFSDHKHYREQVTPVIWPRINLENELSDMSQTLRMNSTNWISNSSFCVRISALTRWLQAVISAPRPSWSSSAQSAIWIWSCLLPSFLPLLAFRCCHFIKWMPSEHRRIWTVSTRKPGEVSLIWCTHFKLLMESCLVIAWRGKIEHKFV